MKNTIENSLKSLITSQFPKTQMDVFHKGLVVLQVFNQSDVKNWSFDIPLNEEGGIVLNLFFNKNKKNNKENYSRFEESPFFKDFIFVELNRGKIKSFYSPIPRATPIGEIARMINTIISQVYQIGPGEPLDILVRAF
ncbi:MAG: hypothetical protein H6573_22085 [Lewinellaceae bacterium]|nr:hypothetical protein [Lewinellaceae bacterium]